MVSIQYQVLRSERKHAGAMTESNKKNLMLSYLNWTLSLLMPLALVPLFVRLLGHEQYGEWIIIATLGSYLSVGNLGIRQTVTNRIAEAIATNNRPQIGLIISTAFFTQTAIALALMIALSVLAALFWHQMLSRYGNADLTALLVFISLCVLSLPFRIYASVLRGFERVDQQQTIEIAAIVTRTVAIAIALLSRLRLVGVATIYGGVSVLAGATAWVCAYRSWPEARLRLSHFSSHTLLRIAKPSAGFLAMEISTILNQGMDNLVIGYSLGGAAVTSYAISLRFVMTAAGLFAAALAAITPTITKTYAAQNTTDVRNSLFLCTRLAFSYATMAAILLWLLGPALLRVWAGPGVFPGSWTFALQITYFFFLIVFGPATTTLTATTRHYGFATLVIVEGALNLALSLWWVRYWGVAGVIGATVAASIVTNAWYLPLAACRVVEVSFRDALIEIGPSIALALVAISAVGFMAPSGSQPASPGDLVSAALTIVLVPIAFVRLAFTIEDRQELLEWLKAARRLITIKRPIHDT